MLKATAPISGSRLLPRGSCSSAVRPVRRSPPPAWAGGPPLSSRAILPGLRVACTSPTAPKSQRADHPTTTIQGAIVTGPDRLARALSGPHRAPNRSGTGSSRRPRTTSGGFEQAHIRPLEVTAVGPRPPVLGQGVGLRRWQECSGGCACKVGDWGLVAAPGVPPAVVLTDEPAEHLTAAGDLVGPGLRVLQDLAFEGRVERLRERMVSARADGTHRLGDAEVGAELGVVLRGVAPWSLWRIARTGCLGSAARR